MNIAYLAALMFLGIQVQWNASPDPRVTGYAVVLGQSSRVYNQDIDVGTNLTCKVTTQRSTLYYVSAYAYCYCGDPGGTNRLTSDYANEVLWVEPPPPKPTGFSVKLK